MYSFKKNYLRFFAHKLGLPDIKAVPVIPVPNAKAKFVWRNKMSDQYKVAEHY
jgi:hypothetical protein